MTNQPESKNPNANGTVSGVEKKSTPMRPERDWRTMAGITAVVALIISTLARAFGGPGWLYLPTAGAAALLIVAGYPRINQKLRTSSTILLAAGIFLVPFARDPVAAVQRGVFVAGLLLSLTSCVMLIARCAVQSTRIQQIGAGLRERQGSSRYLSFALTSQFFSGILGLAGANLTFVMAAPAAEQPNAERTDTIVAVSRGFTAASCWSPVFGNMAVLLALYPTLHWIEVFPVGLGVGQLTLIVGAVLFHMANKPAAAHARPPTSVSELFVTAFPLLVSLIGFLVLIMTMSKSLHIVVSAAIILLAPLVSLMFNAAMGRPGQRWGDGIRGLGQGMLLFPAMASEAALFLSAGCAGSIMADAFPVSWAVATGEVLSIHPVLGISFLLLAIMVIALVGIHPILTSVFLASTMTPQVLGLPPIAHMAAILAGWGLSASVTPFSVLSLTASRYSGEGLYQISLGKNAVFALTTSGVVCVLLTAYVLL
ncbi:hypothetical protein [Noviherbaspirillum saxi]|nr:hypothetical protein [Noviherbaspirillum saxi]